MKRLFLFSLLLLVSLPAGRAGELGKPSMDLPRYNLETTVDDLKIGITAEKVLRILGNPLQVNGTQWVYPRGYIYVEKGVVVAMQNRSGTVFAADYK